jgi:hypothetical protein
MKRDRDPSADSNPDSDPDAAARTLVAGHGAAPARALVANLQTRMALLEYGGEMLPASVNDGVSGDTGNTGNTWVCSPLTTYWSYAAEELMRYADLFRAGPLQLLCGGYGRLLRWAGIDRAVAVNNWLVSTNLYPALDEAALSALLDQARQRWPAHALWFRSLNEVQHPAWLAALRARGFVLIPTRQVYLFDDIAGCIGRHGDMRRDMKLLRKTPLIRLDGGPSGDLSAADYERIAALYGLLYLDKYSLLNPQYSARLLQEWHSAGLLRFDGFRGADGCLLAVVGMFNQRGVISAPIVGYDTAQPQSLGLYRLLMACVFDAAMHSGASVNLSAGAAHFKRQRGGRPALEYSAVLATNMPRKTRFALALLSFFTTRLGVAIMKRFKL